MSDRWQVTGGRQYAGRASRVRVTPSAFTLIEIMIVVAIIGLIAAMGVPSILQIFRKEGMRER